MLPLSHGSRHGVRRAQSLVVGTARFQAQVADIVTDTLPIDKDGDVVAAVAVEAIIGAALRMIMTGSPPPRRREPGQICVERISRR